MDPQTLYQHVSSHYTSAAQSPHNAKHNTAIATAFGYTPAELSSIPADSNLGLSCGNPTALANLRAGEVVVDLGCGAGFDVFLAASKVGPSGQAIGVDMNREMLAKARRNLEKMGDVDGDGGAKGVIRFVESRITRLELEDGVADCVISNCVVNLVPEIDKHLVFEEMYRVLKPGGRVAVSDILLKKELSEEMRRNMALYVGCISGASLVRQYEEYLTAAGFHDILIVNSESDLNVYKSDNGGGKPDVRDKEKEGACCQKSGRGCAPYEGQEGLKKSAEQYGDVELNEWAGSYKIYAIKPIVG